MKQSNKLTISDIGQNIRQIRELKSFTQEYMAIQLEISQPTYAKIEKGQSDLKIERLQKIAEILEVDLSTLLSTTNFFNIVFHAPATQSGYINSQTNTNMVDIKTLRKIIREEIEKH